MGEFDDDLDDANEDNLGLLFFLANSASLSEVFKLEFSVACSCFGSILVLRDSFTLETFSVCFSLITSHFLA